MGHYLGEIFPDRPRRLLGRVPSHRGGPDRELWLIERPADWPAEPSTGLDAGTLLSYGLSWPPRSWWREQVRDGWAPSSRFTARGLERVPDQAAQGFAMPAGFWNVPEDALFSSRERLRRGVRLVVRGALSATGMLA
jgi:hypothetical protein